jgi:hypothetical protein
MLELIIKGTTYQFKFKMGFMRELNKMIRVPVDGVPGEKQEIGLSYKIGQMMDGNVAALVDVLVAANKGQEPRVTPALIDEYIDEECEDIDKLFDEVFDFLEKSNATKTVMKKMLDMQKEEEAKKNQ